MFTNNKRSSFFQLYTHQTYREVQNKKKLNSKLKVLSNTIFRISRFRTTDIHRRTERLGIKIVFPNQLTCTMFAGIILFFFSYLYKFTMKMKSVSE